MGNSGALGTGLNQNAGDIGHGGGHIELECGLLSRKHSPEPWPLFSKDFLPNSSESPISSKSPVGLLPTTKILGVQSGICVSP